MLTIENRTNLKNHIVKHNGISYYVEGVYEYPDTYDIHLRSNDKTIVDELFIVLRNRRENISSDGKTYKFYKLYNQNKPNNWVGLTNDAMRNKNSVIGALEYVINKQ